jgi:hypothetical protein
VPSRCSRCASAATRSTPAARTRSSAPAAAPRRTTRASGSASSRASPTARASCPGRSDRAQRPLLAPRRHHARHRARRGRRRGLARALRRVVGPGHRPPQDAGAARDGAPHDGPAGARALLRPRRGAAHHRCRRREEETARWGPDTPPSARQALHAHDTELGARARGLSPSARGFGTAAGRTPELEACASSWCSPRPPARPPSPIRCGAPPRERAGTAGADDSLSKDRHRERPRVAALVARAIRTRELSMLDVWFASLGPVTSALLEAAVRGAIRARRRPPPQPKKRAPAHRGLRAREAPRRGRHRLRVAGAQAGADRYLRAQDPEGRGPRRTPPRRSARASSRRSSRRPRRSRGSTTRTSPTSSTAASRGRALPGARVPHRRRPQAVLERTAA